MNKKIVRVLELDGGGIRGIFSMQFLQQFCQIAGINQITDAFDVICGTSIGGICALGLASGQTPTQLLNILISQGSSIFTYTWGPIPTQGPVGSATLGSLLVAPGVNPYVYNNCYNSSSAARDNSAPLATTLTGVLGNTILGNIKTPVLVTSMAYMGGTQGTNPTIGLNCENIYFPYASAPISSMMPINFSNIKLPWTVGQNASAVNVGLTTSAAPIYFLPVQLNLDSDPINDPWYIDGGLYQNNPVNLGFTLAKTLYPNANLYSVLSVGTGSSFSFPHISNPGANLKIAPTNSLPFLSQLLSFTIEGGVDGATLPFAMSSLYNINPQIVFYRFQADLPSTAPEGTWALDNVTIDFPNALITVANNQMQKDSLKIQSFIQRSGF